MKNISTIIEEYYLIHFSFFFFSFLFVLGTDAVAIHQRQELALAEVQRRLREALLQRDLNEAQHISCDGGPRPILTHASHAMGTSQGTSYTTSSNPQPSTILSSPRRFTSLLFTLHISKCQLKNVSEKTKSRNSQWKDSKMWNHCRSHFGEQLWHVHGAVLGWSQRLDLQHLCPGHCEL